MRILRTIGFSIVHGFGNLLNLQGRDTRRVFWPYAFVALILMCVLMFSLMAAMFSAGLAPSYPAVRWQNVVALALAISVPYLTMCFILFAASVRRLHDSGKSMRSAVIVLGSLATALVTMPLLSLLVLLAPSAALPTTLGAVLFVIFLASGLVWTLGSFWLFYLLLRRGTPGKNQYGPAPKKGQA